MTKPPYWNEATAALMRRDPVLRRLIRSYPGIHLKRRNDAFTALARAIVGQQISVKAADAIWGRFVALVTAAPSLSFPRLAPATVAMAITRGAALFAYSAAFGVRDADHADAGTADDRASERLPRAVDERKAGIAERARKISGDQDRLGAKAIEQGSEGSVTRVPAPRIAASTKPAVAVEKPRNWCR